MEFLQLLSFSVHHFKNVASLSELEGHTNFWLVALLFTFQKHYFCGGNFLLTSRRSPFYIFEDLLMRS